MTNKEKYAEEIKLYRGKRFCSEFIEPKILTSFDCMCSDLQCAHCSLLQAIWLEEEAAEEETSVDWSKVPVDTKILVRSTEGEEWKRMYFARYDNGRVFSFSRGSTSWSANCITPWDYAKLAEVK